MKRILIFILATLCSISINAQNNKEAAGSAWKLRPEFTARLNMGIYQGGYDFTGGVRLNDNWTVGILGGQSNTYVDAAPGHIYGVNTAAFARGYIHLGRKDIFALYGDFYAGACWIYNVTGKYQFYDEENMYEFIHQSKGDVEPLFAFEPGIRIRFYKNIHLFLGPTISTHCRGVHIGIGF